MLEFSWGGQVGSKEEPLKGLDEVAISSLWESNLRRRHDEGTTKASRRMTWRVALVEMTHPKPEKKIENSEPNVVLRK